MNAGALRALEFDRIVADVASLAVTTTGRDRLEKLTPLTDASAVQAAQRATSEGTRFLATHPGFPLRGPSDLDAILEALAVDGRALEPLRLLALADYLESIELTRRAITTSSETFPILSALVAGVTPFKDEIANVRRKIEPSGEVADKASPKLAGIRERLRKQKTRLRTTLETFLRDRDTSKYLQDHVVTDRNGRYVLVVRAEHRGAIPGVVHGASASGASLFLEPLGTVDINNDIVALEEEEAEEVRRILLELTDAFRLRPEDLDRCIEVATEADAIQARARFSMKVDGVEPLIATDGAVELRSARHPLLSDPVAVDILLTPPARVLIITGPNTGGKTVALKTAGLFVAMAQAGLHLPVEKGSRLPVFRSLFADIGDEQSISASLSTFSAHITNLVSMDRNLALPALVLLDEVGAGTDPAEGGALGTAVIDRFRKRGAHLIATTHYDAPKSYASTTEGVVSAAFGFDPQTFAPTYRLIYGSPGPSLAIEIASRLGMPPDVIAAARGNLTEREKQLHEHLAKVDRELRTLDQERRGVERERSELAKADREMRSREASVREREDGLRRRLAAKLDDQLREARKEIDTVIEGLKARVSALSEKGVRRAAIGISTGDAGAARAEARAALDAAVARIQAEATGATAGGARPSTSAGASSEALAPGARVAVGALGLDGVIIEVHEKHADVDVRGKRLRAALRDLRVIGGTAPPPRVNVSVDLQPRAGTLSELNVIGCTVEEAITRVERLLDDSMVTDVHVLRIVHGHGKGQLRRAIADLLKQHPLVARFDAAPMDQGGGGVTVVELKE